VAVTELETSSNEQTNDEPTDDADNLSMLETNVANGGSLFAVDSMTIGELADQKQQRNRTVVIDLAVRERCRCVDRRHDVCSRLGGLVVVEQRSRCGV
jgi:hypothetical protein